MTRRTTPSEWPTCFSSEGAVRRSIGHPLGFNNGGSFSARAALAVAETQAGGVWLDASRYTACAERWHLGDL